MFEQELNRWLTAMNVLTEGHHTGGHPACRDAAAQFCAVLLRWCEWCVRHVPRIRQLRGLHPDDLVGRVLVDLWPRAQRGELVYISQEFLTLRLLDACRQEGRAARRELADGGMAEFAASPDSPEPADEPTGPTTRDELTAALHAAAAAIPPAATAFTRPRAEVFHAVAAFVADTGSERGFFEAHPHLFRPTAARTTASEAMTRLYNDVWGAFAAAHPRTADDIAGRYDKKPKQVIVDVFTPPPTTDPPPPARRARPPAEPPQEVTYAAVAAGSGPLTWLVRSLLAGRSLRDVCKRMYGGGDFGRNPKLAAHLDELVGRVRGVLRPGRRAVVGGARAAGLLGRWR